MLLRLLWSTRDVLLCSPKPPEQEVEMQVEGNLAAEVSLIALDTLELIIQVPCHCLTVTARHTQLIIQVPCHCLTVTARHTQLIIQVPCHCLTVTARHTQLIIQVPCHCLTVTARHTQLAPAIHCPPSPLMGTIVLLLQRDTHSSLQPSTAHPALSWGPLSYCYSETHTACSSHPLPTQPSHGDHCLTVTARHTQLAPAIRCPPSPLMGTIVLLLQRDTHSSLQPSAAHPALSWGPLSYCYSETHTARSSHPLPTQPSHGDHCLTVTARHTQLAPAIRCPPSPLMGTTVLLLQRDTHSSLQPSAAHPALSWGPLSYCYSETHTACSSHPLPTQPSHGDHCLTVTARHTQLAPAIHCPPSPLMGTIVLLLQRDTHSSLQPSAAHPALSWGPLSYSETHSSLLMHCPPSPLMGTTVLQRDTQLSPHALPTQPSHGDHCLTVRHTQLSPHALPIHCPPSPHGDHCHVVTVRHTQLSPHALPIHWWMPTQSSRGDHCLTVRHT